MERLVSCQLGQVLQYVLHFECATGDLHPFGNPAPRDCTLWIPHLFMQGYRRVLVFIFFYFLLQSFVADNSGYQRNDTQQHQTYNKYPHDNITVTNQFCAKLLINLHSIMYAIYFFRTFVCYLQNKHWRVN